MRYVVAIVAAIGVFFVASIVVTAAFDDPAIGSSDGYLATGVCLVLAIGAGIAGYRAAR